MSSLLSLNFLITCLLLLQLALADTWQIPTLTNHFMGSNSGITDGSWPPNKAFNSTMNFTIQYLPKSFNDKAFSQTECSGSWVGEAYPTTWLSCKDSRVKWRFQKSNKWNECNFVLEVAVTQVAQGSLTSLTLLSANVTANAGSSAPTNYLTCISCGPPYSGVCGKTDGMLSNPAPIPLRVVGVEKEAFLPLNATSISTYGPSGRPGQPCQPFINFTVVDLNDKKQTVCTKIWLCSDSDSHLFDHVPCGDSAFWFSITVPDGGNPLENFELRVYRKIKYQHNSSAVTLDGQPINVTISGQSAMKVGDQLGGECGGSGVCYWGLSKGPVALPIDGIQVT
ncbi:hypothetical protein NA57DRAFT_77154 [Rhizodiscina lignyota]|uniref:Uncharacterized protein n=1 Tax=Rhizodiscina lignyota TaxID=1504668 RepID=A0A9P4IFG7_9PEZI|nr:hypothetical protein NA57DRAFT_77154 [Rhizodiscina lignyota]